MKVLVDTSVWSLAFRRRTPGHAAILHTHVCGSMCGWRELKRLGYACVMTRTKNKYRDMLVLNIRLGFDLTGIYKALGEQDQGIILKKTLA